MLHTAPNQRLGDAELDRREAFLREIAASASVIAMAGFAKVADAPPTAMKGPQDYLTETDGKVEQHLRARLELEFPEDGFLGEEGGGTLSERLWIVDPIDGTANFARGIPHFCISIAFLDRGRVELGAIANPAVRESYFARRGRGAARNGQALRVAQTKSFESASVEFGWSTRVPNPTYIDVMTKILARGANVRRASSGALGLAYVADGRSDAYAELHINAWDCLAGLLLVREAGGRINRFLAGGGLTRGNPVLAAAPGIADGMSEATGIALEVEDASETYLATA